MKKLLATILMGLFTSNALLAQTADFQDLPLAPDSFYNGADASGGFTTRGMHFANSYNTTFGSWSGFAYSNKTDTTTPGFTNQYSAIAGSGAGGSSTYGVSYTGSNDAVVTLPAGRTVASASITNTTYAYLSMRDGDGFAKKFGGASGNDPDFFKLTITGLDEANVALGTVDFYLADFRFADNASDYLLSGWTAVDLSALSAARKLSFELTSSDNGTFGMNTPAYFAIDDLVTVPEPAALGVFGLAFVALARRRRR
jgi:hypothetical protein